MLVMGKLLTLVRVVMGKLLTVVRVVMGKLLTVVRVVMGFVMCLMVTFRMSLMMGSVTAPVTGAVMGSVVRSVASVRPAAERRIAECRNQDHDNNGYQNATCGDHETPVGKIIRLAAGLSRQFNSMKA
jgi:hypothetical protein